MLRRIISWLLGAVAVLALVVGIKTLTTHSRQMDVAPLPALAVNQEAVADHLATAVRAKTVFSFLEPDRGAAEFQKLQRNLASHFPKLHHTLTHEVINDQSLLYTWPGSNPTAKPILLLAHQDVVPIAPGTEELWQQPPFSGTRKGGYIWGRGAWDNKSNLIAQMEAVEMLLASGFKPERTIYLALTHDEEVARHDAQTITELLAKRKVKLDFVLDEGLLITDGIMPGLSQPVALIGVAEKGYMSVQLKATATPGHSSMPPTAGSSAIAQLSAALNQLETHQFPSYLGGVAREMLETVAPEMHGFGRVALSNLWLFGPVVRRQLEATGGSTGAMLHTTTALTIVHAGNKENVLPGIAEATVNFRLLPGDTTESVIQHVTRTIANDKIDIKPLLVEASDPSPVAPTNSASYQLLNRTIREVFPGVLVAPGLMVAATDSRRFVELSDHIYKFSPVRATKGDLSRFHGTDERISERNLVEMVRFYHRLLSQGSLAAQ
jgi:carboxypeptidase PM20D1